MDTFVLKSKEDTQALCNHIAQDFNVSEKFTARDCELLFSFVISGLRRSGHKQKDIYRICKNMILNIDEPNDVA